MKFWKRALFLFLGLGALSLVYHFFDPLQSAWMPQCPFLQLTGWQCATCGMQRAAHALLQGELLVAARYNWFLLLLVPYVLAGLLLWLLPEGRWKDCLSPIVGHRYLAIGYVVAFGLWLVLRNVLGV